MADNEQPADRPPIAPEEETIPLMQRVLDSLLHHLGRHGDHPDSDRGLDGGDRRWQ